MGLWVTAIDLPLYLGRFHGSVISPCVANGCATMESRDSKTRDVRPIHPASEEQGCQLFQDSNPPSDLVAKGIRCVVSASDAIVAGFHGIQSMLSGRDFGEVPMMFSILVDKAFAPSLASLSLLLRSLPSPISDLRVPRLWGDSVFRVVNNAHYGLTRL